MAAAQTIGTIPIQSSSQQAEQAQQMMRSIFPLKLAIVSILLLDLAPSAKAGIERLITAEGNQPKDQLEGSSRFAREEQQSNPIFTETNEALLGKTLKHPQLRSNFDPLIHIKISQPVYPFLIASSVKDKQNIKGNQVELSSKIQVLLGIASSHSRRKEYEDAIKAYDQIIDLDRYNTTGFLDTAYYWRSIAEADLGNYANALEDINKSIEYGFLKHSPQNGYETRARYKFKLNDLRGALADYDQLILDHGEKLGAYSYIPRSEIKFLLGDQKGACNDYMKAPTTHKDPQKLKIYCQ